MTTASSSGDQRIEAGGEPEETHIAAEVFPDGPRRNGVEGSEDFLGTFYCRVTGGSRQARRDRRQSEKKESTQKKEGRWSIHGCMSASGSMEPRPESSGGTGLPEDLSPDDLDALLRSNMLDTLVDL